NDIDFKRGTFRVRGDSVEVIPASKEEHCIRIEFFGDEIDRIREVDALTGEIIGDREHVAIFPASHFVTREEKMRIAIKNIDKVLEEQRIEQSQNYDIEMMREMNFCSVIENYSRHLTLREPVSTTYTLMDFFTDDFLVVIDESHSILPLILVMFNGDKTRK